MSDINTAWRAHVEEQGSDAPRELYELFDEFNREHFEAKLSVPLILVSAPNSPRALGSYHPRDEHGVQARITIPARTIKKGEGSDTLLHEMVHQWCDEISHAPEPSFKGHGPVFATKCNEIGKVLGVPEVVPRGKRKGKPDPSTWPHRKWPPEEKPKKPKKKTVGQLASEIEQHVTDLRTAIDDNDRKAIDANLDKIEDLCALD